MAGRAGRQSFQTLSQIADILVQSKSVQPPRMRAGRESRMPETPPAPPTPQPALSTHIIEAPLAEELDFGSHICEVPAEGCSAAPGYTGRLQWPVEEAGVGTGPPIERHRARLGLRSWRPFSWLWRHTAPLPFSGIPSRRFVLSHSAWLHCNRRSRLHSALVHDCLCHSASRSYKYRKCSRKQQSTGAASPPARLLHLELRAWCILAPTGACYGY